MHNENYRCASESAQTGGTPLFVSWLKAGFFIKLIDACKAGVCIWGWLRGIIRLQLLRRTNNLETQKRMDVTFPYSY